MSAKLSLVKIRDSYEVLEGWSDWDWGEEKIFISRDNRGQVSTL